MKNQVGAKYLKNERKHLNAQSSEPVITCHVKRESELIRLKSGAVKRVSTTCV